jgi:hypothetical protein
MRVFRQNQNLKCNVEDKEVGKNKIFNSIRKVFFQEKNCHAKLPS